MTILAIVRAQGDSNTIVCRYIVYKYAICICHTGRTKGAKLVNLEKIFGKVLQEIRQKKGISQESLGFESGYHRTYISILERGKKSPSLTTIFDLAKALEVAPSYILHQIEIQLGMTSTRKRKG
jgi:DNA-binding XRE family transcriptional regulator